MDAFELNKIVGAVLFALMVLFGTRTVTNIIFAVPEPEKPGYEVEVAEQEGAVQEAAEKAEPEVPLAQLLQEASAEQGEGVAKKCAACHTFEKGGANKIGPNLHGIVGRDLASVSDFSYSSAMQEEGGAWTYEKLNEYLADPKGAIPGNKMAFVGVKNDGQRADLLLYLREQTDNPPPLPEPDAEAEPSGEGKKTEAQSPSGQEAENQPPQSEEQKPSQDTAN